MEMTEKPAASGEKDRRTGSSLTKGQVLIRILSNRRFGFAFLQFVLGPLSVMPVITHQAVFFRDQGLSEMTSAWIVGLFGLTTFVGMLCSGFFSDRISREKIYSLGTLFLILGCICLMLFRPGTGFVLPVAYSVFFGLGFGSRPSMDAATAADIFKGRHFGLIYGLLNVGLGLGHFFGPLVGGRIYDVTGNYTIAFAFSIAAVCLSTLCIWLSAPRRGVEIWEI